MPKKDNQKSSKVIFNHNLPTLHIDGIMVSLRKDGVCFLSCITETPEGAFEQCRFFINEDDLKIVIDSLCETTQYCPKPAKKTIKKTK